MKKWILLTVLPILSVFSAGRVYAQTDNPATSINYSLDARTARIAALKATYKISLGENERQQVSSRCAGAQKILGLISAKLNDSKNSRLNDYSSVTSSLTNLRLQLGGKQVDASSLDLLVVEYQQGIQDFESASELYETALDDVVQVDCVQKPDDFRAALEGVRLSRKHLVDKSIGIEQTTKSSLTTAFDAISVKLTEKDKLHGI
jgi:hypothetical protein